VLNELIYFSGLCAEQILANEVLLARMQAVHRLSGLLCPMNADERGAAAWGELLLAVWATVSIIVSGLRCWICKCSVSPQSIDLKVLHQTNRCCRVMCSGTAFAAVSRTGYPMHDQLSNHQTGQVRLKA